MDINDFFVDGSKAEVAEGSFLKRAVVDDPKFTLESLPAADLQRLHMHCIGWMHTEKNIPPLMKLVKKLAPDVYIEENVADRSTDASRVTDSFVINTYLRGLPLYFKDLRNGQERILPIGEHLASSIAESNELAVWKSFTEFKKPPLYRTMDLTADYLKSIGAAQIHYGNVTHYLSQFDKGAWFHHPDLARLRTGLHDYYSQWGAYNKLREQKMIADISTIAANALQRSQGDVTVTAAFGSFHLPMIEPLLKFVPSVTLYHPDGTSNLVAGGELLQSDDDKLLRMGIEGRELDADLIDTVILQHILPDFLDESLIHKLAQQAHQKYFKDGSEPLMAGRYVVDTIPKRKRTTLLNVWVDAYAAYNKDPSSPEMGNLYARFVHYAIASLADTPNT